MEAKNKKGFTLIELLVAIGIVSVLTAVVFVSINGYRRDAREAKIFGSLNSIVTSIYSCFGFNGKVNAPSSNVDICSLSPTYGKWLDLSIEPGNFEYLFDPAVLVENQYLPKKDWSFLVQSTKDQIKICCNDRMKGCEAIEYGGICD